MFSIVQSRFSRKGVTLLELMTVMLIIAILVVLTLPVFAYMQNRADEARCIANLRSLHVATDLFLQEKRHWPQVKTKGVDTATIASSWISTLQPYGINQINWICPTVQRLMNSPDLSNPQNVRIDYSATPFDTNPLTPSRWARQPWFVENGNEHGNGNLIIFPDGHVETLNDVYASLQKPKSPTQ